MIAPYDKLYEHFDSPLMRQLRAEAYGQDIGQHSWVTAEELLADIPKLKLSPDSRLLDLGCGPGGPLTYVTMQTKCQAVGLDVSANAIAAARDRAASRALRTSRPAASRLERADSFRRCAFPCGSLDRCHLASA